MNRAAFLLIAFASLAIRSPLGSAQPTAAATIAPVGVASDDLGYAVDTNAALLPYVPRYSIVAAHQRTVGRGADSVATSVSFALARRGFGMGLGFDRLDSAAGGRGRFSLALGYAANRKISMGLALRVVGPNAASSGTTGVDLSMVTRPSRFFSFSMVTTDILGPVGLDGNRALNIPTRFGGYAAFRPFGDTKLSLEAGLRVDTRGELSARFYASSEFSGYTRAFVVASLDDLRDGGAFSLLAGLDLRIGGAGVGGGLLVDRDGASGFGVFVSLDGRSSGSPFGAPSILEVQLEGSTSARELITVLLALEHARLDPRVVGAVIHLRSSGIGIAAAQELRGAIDLLVDSGEPVTCVLESPSGSELYACAAASETFVERAGTIRLVGPSINLVTFGGLLETLGVHTDFVRIGAYKSATERFTNREPSAESIEQTTRFVDDVYSRLVLDLAQDASVERGAIRDLIDNGPSSPREMQAAGLIRGSIDLHDLEREVHRLHGRELAIREDARDADPTWARAPRVAVVVVDGQIVDRESISIPFLGSRATGADTIVATLEALRRDSSVRSVVLRVESPGGSAVAAERIWRAVRRLSAVKPVIASLGGVAASGGYYIATAASTIYADPSTLTGSIGIYYGKMDVAPLAERLGVGVEAIERGEHAGSSSMFRPLDEGERTRLEELVRENYDLFLERVAEGRGRSVESLEGLAEGRIWSGDRARSNGLVDRLGGLVQALSHARQLGELEENADVVVLPEVNVGLVERLVMGRSSESRVSSIPLARLASLAFLSYGPSEGMFALAPVDEGVR